jgi:hypothetical protein
MKDSLDEFLKVSLTISGIILGVAVLFGILKDLKNGNNPFK